MEDRFDPDLLDPDDPFEVDNGNRAHLFKHLPVRAGRTVAVSIEDILDVYVVDNPIFYPADRSKGDAHWLMYGEIHGMVLVIPLAPPKSGDVTRCRPIGLDGASEHERVRYFRDLRDQGDDDD